MRTTKRPAARRPAAKVRPSVPRLSNHLQRDQLSDSLSVCYRKMILGNILLMENIVNLQYDEEKFET